MTFYVPGKRLKPYALDSIQSVSNPALATTTAPAVIANYC